MNMQDFEKIYKFHGVGVLSQHPINKNISTLLIFTNLKLRFELCVFNLI
jgi:hypothetical protein